METSQINLHFHRHHHTTVMSLWQNKSRHDVCCDRSVLKMLQHVLETGQHNSEAFRRRTIHHLLCFNCLLLTETLQRISCHFFFDVLVFSVQLMSLKLNTSCESFKLKPNEKGLLVWDVCRRWWVKTSQLEATQKYKVKAAEWIRRDSVVVLQRFNLYIYNSWKRRIQEK